MQGRPPARVLFCSPGTVVASARSACLQLDSPVLGSALHALPNGQASARSAYLRLDSTVPSGAALKRPSSTLHVKHQTMLHAQ
jgi:hypothetical protein